MRQQVHQGGCQCGAVRHRTVGDPLMAAFCHCSMCRHANAAPVVAWAMFQESQVAFVKGALTTYRSSSEGRRGFCAACGSQLTFSATSLA